MKAIVGCLLMVSGVLLATESIMFRDLAWWMPALLVCAGIAVLLRPRHSMIDLREHAGCSTCRGAGTVYSAEYNDWRATGPIRVLRELCPSCEGLTP